MRGKIIEYGKSLRIIVLAVPIGFLVLRSTSPLTMAGLSLVSLYAGCLASRVIGEKYRHICFMLEVIDEKLNQILKES